MSTTTTMPGLPATFATTRDALHRLAVYVISPAQRLANGEIILRATPGGFSTFPFAGRIRSSAIAPTASTPTASRASPAPCARGCWMAPFCRSSSTYPGTAEPGSTVTLHARK